MLVLSLFRPKKINCLFVSCNSPIKNRVGRWVKKKLDYFLVQKCVFHACFKLIGS